MERSILEAVLIKCNLATALASPRQAVVAIRLRNNSTSVYFVGRRRQSILTVDVS